MAQMEINKDLVISDSNKTLANVLTDINNLKPFVLYENLNGSTTNFTINDNRNNYRFLEIQYGNTQYYRKITRYYSEEVFVPLMLFYDASWGTQIQTCQFIIRGTSAQRANDKYINCSLSDGSVTCGAPASPDIRIYRVIGYK